MSDQSDQLQAQLATLQAQLRHVEGERDAADAELHRDMVEYCQFAREIALPGTRLPELVDDAISFGKLKDVVNAIVASRDTLRQLVAQLPVVDGQEVSVWLSPDESGWLVSKRPAFPAGLYWAKFRTQAEADSFRALLAYRATLDAGQVSTSIIGKQVPPSQWDKNAGVRGDIS